MGALPILGWYVMAERFVTCITYGEKIPKERTELYKIPSGDHSGCTIDSSELPATRSV